MHHDNDERFAFFTLAFIAAIFAAVLTIAFIITCQGTRYDRNRPGQIEKDTHEQAHG